MKLSGPSQLSILSCLNAIACVMLISSTAVAQFTYTYDYSIEVLGADNTPMKYPMVGGLNGAQFNAIDLDMDGDEDLVIFDKMGEKIFTFLNTNNEYVYTPEYEDIFPEEITRWILLKDFNCDGKKDIFTGSDFGIQVFQNVSTDEAFPVWERFYFHNGTGRSESLLTKGFSSLINLQMKFDDLPSLADFDGDSDLDIMTVRFTGDGTVEYHKNFSMERYGVCDSLVFERQTQAWGGFTQCFCENFAFNNEVCAFNGRRGTDDNGRVMHGVGKALLALDVNGDSKLDLLFSEAECNNIFALQNQGTVDMPSVTTAEHFPLDVPVEINSFPAAYYEDVTFDGIPDLICAPNVFQRDANTQNLKASTWLYNNTGTRTQPVFTLDNRAFIQEDMIDVGDNSVPGFYDVDGDGDLDLFISNLTETDGRGTIYLYENISTTIQPAFRLNTDNYIDFKSLNLSNVKIQFADLNVDGRPDLTFLATDNTDGFSHIFYIINETGFDISSLQEIDLDVIGQENAHFTDINNDGLPDLLIGRLDGSLDYLRNVGSRDFPAFTLQEDSYLGIGNATLRQNSVCTTADLNGDGKEDLLYTDYLGHITIIEDFKGANRSGDVRQDGIVYNALLDDYFDTSLGGRAWPTVANLLGTDRPQIYAGNILGGLKVLVNENIASDFDDLILTLYPNPVNKTELLKVRSNLPAELSIINAVGQQVLSSDRVEAHIEFSKDISKLAAGLYFARFKMGDRGVVRKFVVR